MRYIYLLLFPLFLAFQLHAESIKSEFYIPTYGIAVSIPGDWERRQLSDSGVIFTAFQKTTRNTIGVLAFAPPSPGIDLTRKGLDKSFSDALGSYGRIIDRKDTTFLGKRAYAIIASADFQGLKASIIRIYSEELLQGYYFQVQYSIIDAALFPSNDVDTLAGFISIKKAEPVAPAQPPPADSLK